MPAVERIIKLNNYKEEKEEKEKEINKLGERMRKLEAEWIAIDNKWQDLKGKKVEKNIVYNQKCPKDNCDGYLNEKYICAMCNAIFVEMF